MPAHGPCSRACGAGEVGPPRPRPPAASGADAGHNRGRRLRDLPVGCCSRPHGAANVAGSNLVVSWRGHVLWR